MGNTGDTRINQLVVLVLSLVLALADAANSPVDATNDNHSLAQGRGGRGSVVHADVVEGSLAGTEKVLREEAHGTNVLELTVPERGALRRHTSYKDKQKRGKVSMQTGEVVA